MLKGIRVPKILGMPRKAGDITDSNHGEAPAGQYGLGRASVE